ncbi:uncharacterized protein B0T15DRAFT_242819 [Chaetomium strumarium]|uniref:Uncharacterized protein n=1 Tax=Chaetomium strumarium TaxID=1170767 RepID=A0AAJ0M0H8_9PEZI|nr:hypothetical protein B0T15DRAFT_242819 [Chaetomium strumarium]
MSPHGKRLWPGTARRVETLELVLWSRWIVCGGVGWTTGFGGYIGRLVRCMLYRLSPPCRHDSRKERESAASAPYGYPVHFALLPAAHLAGITSVSEGCQAAYGNVRKDDILTPCCYTLGTLTFHTPLPACCPTNSRLRRPPRTALRKHARASWYS